MVGLLPALPARRKCHPALAVTERSLSHHPVCTGSPWGAAELFEPVPCKQSSPEQRSRRVPLRGVQVLAGLCWQGPGGLCFGALWRFSSWEAPLKGGKECGSAAGITRPGCVGSCVIPHPWKRGVPVGCRLPSEGPVNAVGCWTVAVFLRNQPLRHGGNGKSCHVALTRCVCHVLWLCLGLLVSLQSGTEETANENSRGGGIQ